MARQGYYFGPYPWQKFGILTAHDLNAIVQLLQSQIGEAGGISEAPADNVVYGRINGGWMPVATALRPSPIVVVSSVVLGPIGGDTSIFIENSSGAAIDLVLPAGVYDDQLLRIKDVAGNAGTYNVSLHGPIDGNAIYPLMSDYAGLLIMWANGGWGTI